MRFFDWIKDFFGIEQSTVYLNQQAITTQEVQLAVRDFAICSAINLISGAISKCEFKTYSNGNEFKGDEYYLWNVEPNKNQNSSQFIQEFISKLLYYNECLVLDINGQLIIADDFTQTEYAVFENIFSNVIRGTMKFDRSFKMSEVLYFKYCNNDIQQLLCNLMTGYNNLLNMAIGKYKRSGGRKGIAKVDKTPSGDSEFQKKVDDLFNNRFKSYFEAENSVIHIPKGVEYIEQNGEGNKKSTSDLVDISKIIEEEFDRVAQAFKIPPALLKGDIADIGKLTDNFLTFCIDPLVDLISEEINRKRYGKKVFLKNSYLKIDTTCIKHIDIFSISEAFDKLVASGGYSIDELRIKAGDIPLNTDFSKKHWMTKNYTDIQTVKGGEE
ncbi:phage portal protein, HK97 family [Caloramator quimbayensis]|uniref:Phage portal protein, HK97 family n=1 Tax=Caloramator quimbayensis TaxID=1147123 RepID=A0A1T4YDA6_9CLOT|nr:phage portal protein [Caloramator quimbayensis]SKA99807.1 phage portal protein, HK97 family [Caloramator quimbayensis]